MAATTTLWASGTPTTTGSTWTNAANAAGTNNATVATFTTATSGAAGVINLTGYGAQTAIGSQPTSVDSVVVTAYQYVATVARWTSVTVGVYDGATLIGSAQTATLSATTTNSQQFTFTGVTWANLANLTVRATATKSGTQSSTFNVDAASVVVNYTPPASTFAAAGTVAAVSAVAGAATVVLAPVTYQAAGTVAASSNTSTASAALLAVAAGVLVATSSVTGAASVVPAPTTYQAAGTVAGTTATSGSATARLAATGTVAGTSSVSGAATLRALAAGTIAASSSAQGSATVVAGLVTYQAAGTVAASSATSGAATARLRSAGTVVGTSSTSGAASVVKAPVTYAAAGVVAVVSSTSGAATVAAPVPDVVILSVVEHQRAVTIVERPRPLTITERPQPIPTITGVPVRLHTAGREFYALEITTTPAVAAWEASFDGGQTWKPGTVEGDAIQWLVAGPQADPGNAVAVLNQYRTQPQVRAVDAPEVIVRNAPKITLER